MANLIVTERWIKDSGLINDNADPKVITPTIVLVQDVYIHPLLGTDLYEEIQSQIANDTVSVNNQTLLDSYVLPAILWYVHCEASPAMQYRYMNKGVMTKTTDNAQPVDIGVLKFAMDKWKNFAEMYAQRTTKFLKANTTTYPKYISNSDTNDIHPINNSYRCSIYLPDTEDDDCCPGYYS
jgi:hypothetical protein